MGKEALAVLGTLVGVVVALTLVGGGTFSLGTSQAGPYFGVGFTGPQHK